MSAKLNSTLVSTDWLAQHLDDSDLRIFDCTVFIIFDPDKGISVRAGRSEFEEAHIPGAAFVDLYRDLSDQASDRPYMMMPSPEAFSKALSAAGLGNDHQVVIYSSDSVMWAARLWWMLRANGFTNAAVLDGGLRRWKAEGRPTVRKVIRRRPLRPGQIRLDGWTRRQC
jgi:thiosulfate/3-mercaptopyruvate sulfurtransferase